MFHDFVCVSVFDEKIFTVYMNIIEKFYKDICTKISL